MVFVPLITAEVSLKTPSAESVQYNLTFDESYSSKAGLIRFKKGDYGIRIYIKHNSEYQVYYKFDDSSTETALLYNRYFILSSAHTAVAGDHVITFIMKNEAQRITSSVTFEYSVCDLSNISTPIMIDDTPEEYQPSILHTIHFRNEYDALDRNIKIKEGDYGIKINCKKRTSRTSRDVFYCIDSGEEMPLAGNGHVVISLADTSEVGNHTIRYVERNDSGFLLMKVTRFPVTLYTVY